MVSVTMSSPNCTDVQFLESGVKVNGQYYLKTVLCNKLMPDIKRVDGWYIFQQARAPAIELWLYVPWSSRIEKRLSSFCRLQFHQI